MLEDTPRPLVGAVLTNHSIVSVIFEQQASRSVADEAGKIVLNIAKEQLDGGGVTLQSYKTMALAKKGIGSHFHDLIGRYAMTVVLGNDSSISKHLTYDLLSTTYRAAAISILSTAREILRNDGDQKLIENIDKLWTILSHSKDTRQFDVLRRERSYSIVADAANETRKQIQSAYYEFFADGVSYAEPQIFLNTTNVFFDAATRLKIGNQQE